jgi:hypothetical protein
MAVRWHCDNCGNDGHVNPPTAPVFIETEVIVGDGKTAGSGTKVKQKVPKMNITKRQDPATGEIKDIPVQEIKDLDTRIHIVRVSVGQETIQKDLCSKCLEIFKEDLKLVWNKLNGIKRK